MHGWRWGVAGVLALIWTVRADPPIVVAAPPATCTTSPDPAANLIANGDFSLGLSEWSAWTERGALNPTTSSGELRVGSGNHNGGLWQRFATGGAGTTIDIDGSWASDPTRANAQWSEVIIINSSAVPVDGVDVKDGQEHVELIYKSDSWRSPGGWSGEMCASSHDGSGGSFVARGDWATILLKSGNVGNAGDTGTIFRDIVVNRRSGNRPPQPSIESSPRRGQPPLSVTFDARTSIDPDGDPLTFGWSFGDGSPDESGETVAHVFAALGSYEVTLTARDPHGNEGTARTTVVVFDDAGGLPSLDTDPGLVWLEDRFEHFWGSSPRGWTRWRQGVGDAEWNIVPGESGWGQELKKTGVRVGLLRENRGFVAGESFRVALRARLGGGLGTPSISIGIDPEGGQDPARVEWGDALALHDRGEWVDVEHDFTAGGFHATLFLRVDFSNVVDGSVVVDNVSWARLTPRPPYPWEADGSPPAEPPYIYGMHDAGAEHLFNAKGRQGWIVHAIAIGDDPDDESGMRFSGWVDGHGCIARISYGFGDTLPHPSRFARFAERAKNFVSNSFGCGIWSIANEPTLERAGGVPITPELYRDAFVLARDAILSVRPEAQVITAGMVQGDFEFFERTMRLLEGRIDGIAIHSYTNANYWHEGNFNLYHGLMERIPVSMRHLPVYMTEAGNGATGPYPDRNHGFIQLMFGNVHDWNQTPGNQPIRSVNFYRWRNADQWGIETKRGMIDDFSTALETPFYWRQP